MTIVEFYDHTPIDNMISCLANEPEKIIFIGERKVLAAQEEHFYRFLDEMDNFTTVLEFKSVNRTSLSSIVACLTAIVQDNEEVCFDLTGGDDLCLVAAGIVYERFPEKKIQLHRYNVSSGKIYDCDGDGTVADGEVPSITVEQNVILHGGAVVTAEQKPHGTIYWDLTLEFMRDVGELWKLCKSNINQWNFQLSVLAQASKIALPCEDPLFLCCSWRELRQQYEHRGFYIDLKSLFPELARLGYIRDMRVENDYFSLYFRDEQIRRCLTKAGTLLELKTYVCAMQVEENGDYLFNDGLTGVLLDWDGVVFEGGTTDTCNEVDVILMHGLVPVFISCKNGSVDSGELYKLNTVAERFGGKYAKRVLVCSGRAVSAQADDPLADRAKLMGITIIDSVQDMNDEEFSRRLKNIVH